MEVPEQDVPWVTSSVLMRAEEIVLPAGIGLFNSLVCYYSKVD